MRHSRERHDAHQGRACQGHGQASSSKTRPRQRGRPKVRRLSRVCARSVPNFPGHASNPYTGRIIGHRDNSKDPVNVAVTLHGTLTTQRFFASSKWGNRLIETVASWAILLILTGVFLWWPRGRQRSSLRGVVVPRTEGRKGSHTLWRDVHAISGVLFAFVILFFLFTGMLWTQVAGSNVHKVVNGTYGQAFAQMPNSTKIKDVDPSGPWATSQIPVPASGQAEAPQARANQASSSRSWCWAAGSRPG